MTNARQASRYAVYLGQEGKDVDYGNDSVTYLVPMSIEWMAGGRCRAAFKLDLSQTGGHIENITTPVKWNRQVEVWAIVDEVPSPIFWGELNHQTIEISQEENASFLATVEPWHFGFHSESLDMWSSLANEFVAINDGEIVVNPVIDGEVMFNMSSKSIEISGTNNARAWIDPESVRTEAAQTANEQTAEEWTIPELLHSLCWMLNPEETNIDNFDKDDARYDGMFEEAPPIIGLRMKMGAFLPDYLDAILRPLGFNWFVELVPEARRIVVFKDFAGEEKNVKLQAIGEEFDFQTTNTSMVALEHSLAAVVNEVVCMGGVEEIEMTVELYRAWEETDDALTSADLDLSDPDSDYETKPNVWRKFVANEAGDYCELRETVEPIPDTPAAWNTVFESYIPRRRSFKQCLTLDADGDVQPPFVEYYDGTDWLPVPREWSPTVLRRECGIYFAGTTPPDELISLGEDAKIRVTATIVGDKRLKADARTTADSPSGRTQPMFLDVSDRFFKRQRQADGTFASVLTGSLVDEVDDEEAIEEYAEEVLSFNQFLGLNANITLIDVNTEYKIGQLLTKIEGREITLNLNSEAANEPKYPQVIGIVWEPQDVRTKLVTAT